jgi:hypothetical protein
MALLIDKRLQSMPFFEQLNHQLHHQDSSVVGIIAPSPSNNIQIEEQKPIHQPSSPFNSNLLQVDLQDEG